MYSDKYSINSPAGEKQPLLTDTSSSGSEKLTTMMKVETPLAPSEPFPPEPTSAKSGSSTFGSVFNFAKASVGSGSFALPWGIAQAGVLLGSVAMVVIGALSLYTMLLIVEIKRGCQVVEKRNDIDLSTMGKICMRRIHIKRFPMVQICMGVLGRILVDVSVLICNLGVCAGYIVFIGGNLRFPLHCWVGYPTSIWLTYAIVIPILILLTLIPSFRFLAYASMVGWVFLAVAMCTVYYYGIDKGFNVENVVLFDIKGFPLFYGVTAFLFCVHSMVVPVELEMAKPTQMNIVLLIAGAVVVIVNLPFAVYGYLIFGSDTKGVIFDNLPSGIFNNIVRLMLSVELTLTFPLVFKPASQIFENYLDKILPRLKYLKIVVMRLLLVLISFSLAIFVPYFQFMAALVGGFATTLLAFIWPPLFHFLLLRKRTNVVRNVFHILLLVFGIVSIVTTTFTTIQQIIVTETANVTNTTSNISIVCETAQLRNLSNLTHSSRPFLLSEMFH